MGNAPPVPMGASAVKSAQGAALYALRETWAPEDWPAQRGATVASQLATAWLNPATPGYPIPFYNAANWNQIRALWPAENWPSQVLIGGGVGALTAAPFIPSAAIYTTNQPLRTILRASWWTPESWPAQSGATVAGRLATVVNPPVIFPAPPYSQRMAILLSWPQEQWYAQSEGAVAAGLAQIQQPPLYLPSTRVPQLALINSQWPRDDWRAQSAPAGAGAWFVPLVTALPVPPRHFEVLQWPQESWPVQRGATIASLFALAPQAQPFTAVAQLMALVQSWPQEQWATQRAAIIASLFAAEPASNPFTNVSLQMILRGIWQAEQWAPQSAPLVAGMIAPIVPPPIPRVLVSTAVYAIVNAGLEVFIQYATDPVIPAGFVISQVPAEFTTVPEWTVVTLTVSTGPAAPPGHTAVPPLIGLFAKDATTALQTSLLSVDRYLWKIDPSAEGTVIAQSIASPLVVPVGTIVQLTLSAGLANPAPTTNVPLVH